MMPSKNRTRVPTSVILRQEQKDFLKREAVKNERSFSDQVRFVVTSWVDFQMKKEKRSGKESKKAQEVGE